MHANDAMERGCDEFLPLTETNGRILLRKRGQVYAVDMETLWVFFKNLPYASGWKLVEKLMRTSARTPCYPRSYIKKKEKQRLKR